MLAHSRPGLSRLKAVLLAAAVLAAMVIGVIAVESWSYLKLMRQGALDTLEDMNFSDRFSSGAAAPVEQIAAAPDLETADDPALGNERAPIRIVEFVDFSCPYCKDENAIIRTLALDHPDRVRLQARDFPVDELHPDARRAALAAACANEQGKYWAMNDALFANQKDDGSWNDDDLRRYALGVGADGAEYDACLRSGKHEAEIQADKEAGARAGVTGTPTFFVNGIKIEGAVPADIWEKILKLVK